jgi:hypothetical protein
VAVDTAPHLVEVREKMMALVTAQKAVELSLAVLDTECSLGTGKVLAMPGAVQKADKVGKVVPVVVSTGPPTEKIYERGRASEATLILLLMPIAGGPPACEKLTLKEL